MNDSGPVDWLLDLVGLETATEGDVKEVDAESAGFMQADVADLPHPPSSVDVILSEGVMHHTPSWHVVKAFHDPNLDLDELNHLNFDCFAPLHAHRQTPDQVRSWCEESGLVIDREVVEDAEITMIARKADR